MIGEIRIRGELCVWSFCSLFDFRSLNLIVCSKSWYAVILCLCSVQTKTTPPPQVTYIIKITLNITFIHSFILISTFIHVLFLFLLPCHFSRSFLFSIWLLSLICPAMYSQSHLRLINIILYKHYSLLSFINSNPSLSSLVYLLLYI